MQATDSGRSVIDEMRVRRRTRQWKDTVLCVVVGLMRMKAPSGVGETLGRAFIRPGTGEHGVRELGQEAYGDFLDGRRGGVVEAH